MPVEDRAHAVLCALGGAPLLPDGVDLGVGQLHRLVLAEACAGLGLSALETP